MPPFLGVSPGLFGIGRVEDREDEGEKKQNDQNGECEAAARFAGDGAQFRADRAEKMKAIAFFLEGDLSSLAGHR